MSHISFLIVALLAYSAAAQAQQDRRFSALAEPASVDPGRHGARANPGFYDHENARGAFGASSAAAVSRELGY